MPEPLLSQREFDTWREGDMEFKQQILTHISSQTQLNLSTEGRLTDLEAHKRRVTTRAGVVASVVSAIAGGVAGWLGGVWR